jgi:hypothetical protein
MEVHRKNVLHVNLSLNYKHCILLLLSRLKRQLKMLLPPRSLKSGTDSICQTTNPELCRANPKWFDCQPKMIQFESHPSTNEIETVITSAEEKSVSWSPSIIKVTRWEGMTIEWLSNETTKKPKGICINSDATTRKMGSNIVHNTTNEIPREISVDQKALETLNGVVSRQSFSFHCLR